MLHVVPTKIPMYVKYADRDNLYGLRPMKTTDVLDNNK